MAFLLVGDEAEYGRTRSLTLLYICKSTGSMNGGKEEELTRLGCFEWQESEQEEMVEGTSGRAQRSLYLGKVPIQVPSRVECRQQRSGETVSRAVTNWHCVGVCLC